MQFTASDYTSEPVRYPALQVVDLFAEGAAVTARYRNMVIHRVNDSCLRLAVFEEVYRWHFHPASDELFLVVEGLLIIELEGAAALQLKPWQSRHDSGDDSPSHPCHRANGESVLREVGGGNSFRRCNLTQAGPISTRFA